MRWGFTVDDIEKMAETRDLRFLPEVIRQVIKLQEAEKIEAQLDMAEAFNLAYVGSKPGKDKHDRTNQRAYEGWRRRRTQEWEKFLGIKRPTIWERARAGKKSRRF